jgi:hypothetical protein
VTTTASTVLATDFDGLLATLSSPAFCIEGNDVLYCKQIEGSTMSLDQWLGFEKGRIVYTSRLMQLDEAHPSYPVQAEYSTELPLEQARAMAASWIAEAALVTSIRDLQRSLAAYRRDV